MNWHQLATILWLRWRLSLNQWRRVGALGKSLSLLVIVLLLLITAGGAIGGFAGGAFRLTTASPGLMMLVWDAIVVVFLFLWFVGLLSEIQRAESIDLSRLLHLPISLKQVFAINYVASHLTLSVILTVPMMTGLAVGLFFGRGPLMLHLLPLALSFVLMITAWTYCLRGWLISLMTNQRRRRTIILSVTATFIAIAQVPNFYFNLTRDRGSRPRAQAHAGSRASKADSQHSHKELPPTWVKAHRYVPLLWLPNGASALASGNAGASLLGTFGASVLAGLGLWRAYRGTARFYQGKESRLSLDAPVVSASVRRRESHFLERSLPVIPTDAGILAQASFRSMIRAPEIRMALLTSSIMLIAFGGVFLSGLQRIPNLAKPFLATGSACAVFFGLLQLLFNQFGADRSGFRALILLPTRRDRILLGKNLAFLPLVLTLGAASLTVFAIAARIPWSSAVPAVFQMLAACCLVSLVGNLFSILVPYRVAAGALKPTKLSAKTTLFVLGSHLSFPLLMSPVFLSPVLELICRTLGWFPSLPINLLLSIAILAIVAIAYWSTLSHVGNLLQQRELKILEAVTHEVE